jgi:prepilin-type N-terminal cleavage/methylation domain-containing protein
MQQTGHKSGFTVAELLIAIAIAGMLLAAVAVAFNASATNYRENEEIFETINAARQALTRITSQLRTSYAVNLGAPDNECSFFTSAGESITYRYDSGQGRLYLRTNSDGQEYILCENVTDMSFTKTPTDDGLDVKSVQISITVASGNAQRTVSAAATIRRNLN